MPQSGATEVYTWSVTTVKQYHNRLWTVAAVYCWFSAVVCMLLVKKPVAGVYFLGFSQSCPTK